MPQSLKATQQTRLPGSMRKNVDYLFLNYRHGVTFLCNRMTQSMRRDTVFKYQATHTWLRHLSSSVWFKATVPYQAITKGCSRIILGGAASAFLSCGGRVFCWQYVRRVGGKLSWGQGVFDPYWGRLIKALTCPGGRGALTVYVSRGWRGLKKNVAYPPQDNFWNSRKRYSNRTDFHTIPCSYELLSQSDIAM